MSFAFFQDRFRTDSAIKNVSNTHRRPIWHQAHRNNIQPPLSIRYSIRKVSERRLFSIQTNPLFPFKVNGWSKHQFLRIRRRYNIRRRSNCPRLILCKSLSDLVQPRSGFLVVRPTLREASHLKVKTRVTRACHILANRDFLCRRPNRFPPKFWNPQHRKTHRPTFRFPGSICTRAIEIS